MLESVKSPSRSLPQTFSKEEGSHDRKKSLIHADSISLKTIASSSICANYLLKSAGEKNNTAFTVTSEFTLERITIRRHYIH